MFFAAQIIINYMAFDLKKFKEEKSHDHIIDAEKQLTKFTYS